MKFLVFVSCILMIVTGLVYDAYSKENLHIANSDGPMRVDFGYAFATPHRLTVSLPNSSDKTLVDVYPHHLRLKWSYDNLLSKPIASFSTPDAKWHVLIKPEVDGNEFKKSTWRRVDGWLPIVETIYSDQTVIAKMQIIGAESAALIRIEMENNDKKIHRITINCSNDRKTTVFNPAWIQSDWDSDVMLAGMEDRADRIILFMTGGDDQPVNAVTTISQVWNLEPGEKRTGWIVRPYSAYHSQLVTLRKGDWAREFNAAQNAWYELINKAVRIHIPDIAVQNAFYAGLADCFIMREPASDEYIACTPGTEKYRAASSGEPSIVSIFLDQVGLHTDAAQGLQICIDQQGIDGNWNDPKGWAHYMWFMAGFKSWAIMEHYLLTKDRDYLASVYPRMRASSHWQESQRLKTRKLIDGKRTPDYGLMPRGMGDCGLMDGEDLFGVFLPHNIWTVFADSMTLEAARILKKSTDIEELSRIHDTALNDLKWSLEQGAISENGYQWIPGVANKTDGSRWGALYASYPCDILPRDHKLIEGTIRKIESYISPGGIPVNTGWLKDGLWVAIALDNLAEVQLYRDEGDAAIKYLYATLNHGTPLYSWCEERGQEAGSGKCTGDLQHLWTPLAVGRFIRDALVMEDDNTLHLARGTARQWLGSGQPIGVKNMVTHFGHVSFEVRYDESEKLVTGFIEINNGVAPHMILHVRLPAGLKMKSLTDTADGMIGTESATLEWRTLSDKVHFKAMVR